MVFTVLLMSKLYSYDFYKYISICIQTILLPIYTSSTWGGKSWMATHIGVLNNNIVIIPIYVGTLKLQKWLYMTVWHPWNPLVSHNILICTRRIFLVIHNTYKYFLTFLFSLEKYKLLDKSNTFIDKFRHIIIITILY